jgi:hypothetical protein
MGLPPPGTIPTLCNRGQDSAPGGDPPPFAEGPRLPELANPA